MVCIGILIAFCTAAEPSRAPSVRCPPLRSYSTAVQRRAAEELRRLPPGSPVGQLVADYGTLRARCRAVQ